MKRLQDLHHNLADKIDTGLHSLEENLRKKGGFIGRFDVIVEGVRDAIMGGTNNMTKQAPYLRDSIGIQRYMIMPIVVCIPLLLMAIYLYGWRTMVVVGVTYAFGVLAELIFVVVRKHEITEGVLVTCMLYALFLPPTIPLWMVAVGIVFAVIVGKEIFGGTGYNIFNVAIVGRAFLLISFPVELTTQWLEPLTFAASSDSLSWMGGFLHFASSPDAATTATPLQLMKFEGEATPLLDLFLGIRAGSLGESSILFMLIGTGILIGSKIADWRLTVVMMLSIGAFGQFFNLLIPDVFRGDGLFMMMTGGAFYAALLHITDPVTSCMSQKGKIILAVLVGLLTVLIRNLTGYNEGVTFAILIGNMFVPLLDRMTLPKSFAGEAKT